jgi:acyl carrier protein
MNEMTNDDIQQIIFDAIEMANNARDDDKQIPVSQDTELYGSGGKLDSMGLVAFLVDIEESFQDNDINISLSDERAMYQSHSPFRNVKSLTDYIATLIKEAE